MVTNLARLEVGQQAPPLEGYSIERFEGYLDEMAARLATFAKRKDHRAVFELTYLVFSKQILAALKARRFEDQAWATDMACRFIEVYRYQLALWERRDPSLCRAWRVAFQAMEEGRIDVLQAMLLGINAHINYDLAFVTLGSSRHAGDLPENGTVAHPVTLARTGVPTVRYRDFLVVNQIEWEAIELVQDAVLKEHNRLFYWANRLTLRATRFLGQRFLMEARDSAWYQMTLLVHARDDEERLIIARLIDARAAGLADLIRAFRPRPDEIVENSVSWIRRGERIDPELQARVIALVRDNPVVADLGLRELAFAGADPISILLTLTSYGDVRAAGMFGRMVLAVAPRRAQRQLRRFLEMGTEQGVAILEALLDAGLPLADLQKHPPFTRAPRLDVSVDRVRERWTDQLARNRACASLEQVRANATLGEALAQHSERLQARVASLGPRSSDAPHPTATHVPALTLEDARRHLGSHADPWVRACARADPSLGAALAEDGDTMTSIIERVLFLKETQIFMEVDVPTLVYVAENLEARTYEVGDTVVRSGGRSGGLFVIAAGAVEVVQRRDGHEVVITKLGPRDSVGELSALNDMAATADCRALTRVECYLLPTPVLTDLLHQHPRLAIGLISMLSKRLSDTTLRVGATSPAPEPS